MIELIPAIDIIEGKCVRLSKGDYNQKKVYNEDPLEVAKAFEAEGIGRLHVVDLDGAKAQQIVNYKVLERIATQTRLVVDFGGGLKKDEDLRVAFECGAAMVTGGSIAVKNKELFCGWIEKFGSERIILGADVRDRKIAVSGWLETSELELFPFLSDYFSRGIRKVISTDIERDGMLTGPALPLYREIKAEFPEMYVIASGGVSDVSDILALDEAGIDAVIFGKAFYEGRITFDDLRKLI